MAQKLTADDQHFIAAVRGAEAAVQAQERRVAVAADHLREQRTELRRLLGELRNIARSLPLLEN